MDADKYPFSGATHSTLMRAGNWVVQVFVKQKDGMWIHARYGYQVHPMIEPEQLRTAGGSSTGATIGRGGGPNREQGR